MRRERGWHLVEMGAGAQRGQGLLELALMTPILLLLIGGIVEAGLAFNTYIQLANASREGARVGALSPADTSGIDQATRRELPPSIAGGVTVTVACAAAASSTYANCVSVYSPSSGDKLQVMVSYNYTPLLPLINGITTIAAITMSSQTVMQVQ